MDSGITNKLRLLTRFGGVSYIAINSVGYTGSIASTDSRGFFNGTRTASNLTKLFKNGTQITTSTALSILLPTNNVYISAGNGEPTAALFSSKQVAFSSLGDGLTDTEAANLYSRVQQFQVSLSRNV